MDVKLVALTVVLAGLFTLTKAGLVYPRSLYANSELSAYLPYDVAIRSRRHAADEGEPISNGDEIPEADDETDDDESDDTKADDGEPDDAENDDEGTDDEGNDGEGAEDEDIEDDEAEVNEDPDDVEASGDEAE